MTVIKDTSKEVVLSQSKTLTRETHNDVLTVSNGKTVVKDTQARAVFGADVINRISDMEAIGIKLNGMESTITQLTEFEAGMDSTLATLQTNIQSDYESKDTELSNALKTYADATIASETQARAVSEAQLKTEYQNLNTTTNSRIDTVETSISDETLARTTSIAQLETAYKNADTQLSNSLIQHVDDSISTESEARATAISTLTTNYNNVTAQLQSIDTTLSTVNGWSASSSKLITDADGNITGWQFSDGSYQDSSFTIYADTFRLGNGSTNDTPFEIDVSSGKAKFKGIVEFTNTDMSAYENSNVDLTPYATKTELEEINTFGLKSDSSNVVIFNNTVYKKEVDETWEKIYSEYPFDKGAYLNFTVSDINFIVELVEDIDDDINTEIFEDVDYDGSLTVYTSDEVEKLEGVEGLNHAIIYNNKMFKYYIDGNLVSQSANYENKKLYLRFFIKEDCQIQINNWIQLAVGTDGDSAYAIWLSEGNSGTTTDFINALRGADGVDGSDGIAGTDGVDGITYYTWIKYADSPDGSVGFSNVPTDKAYIGLSFNNTTATESENYADYTWALLEGVSQDDLTNAIDSLDWQTEVQNALDNDSTTIDGSRILTGTISANRLDVNDIFSKNITYTGTITGGNIAGGGIIQSYDGNMVINLVNGSIYIA